MKPIDKRVQEADQLLAPYAILHEGILGRMYEEPGDTTRFPFQRDRDRIIHSLAFRRLKGKTQVFVAGEGDHFRTRLTHTVEVAQISRDIARTLQLNEDLAECIALAHDLGHPPFGHAGEDALNEWMQSHGSHFEHNEQSYRVVTVLEEHSTLFPGLNLSREVLDGLLKHHSAYDHPPPHDEIRRTLEAQVVNIADEIAYTGHDCDDGLRAGFFSLEEIQEVPLAKMAHEKRKERGTALRGAIIDLLVTDLYAETEKRLTHIKNVDAVFHASEVLVGFSLATQKRLDELREFLWTHFYESPSIVQENTKGKKIVTSLCTALTCTPPDRVMALMKKTDGALEEAVKDYVAGMTDDFAAQY